MRGPRWILGVVTAVGVALAAPAGAAVAAVPRVTGLRCTPRPGFVATCSWKAVAGRDITYQLNWARSNGRSGVRDTSATSLRLGPGARTTYQYRVRAVLDGRPGAYTDWVSVVMKAPITSQSDGVSDATLVAYGSHTRQRYYALLPPAEAGRRRAVVVIHGGYWRGGSAVGRSFGLNQQLYAEGIPSFALEYRFSTEARWPAQRDDVFAALDSIKDRAVRFGIDPDRISLIGMSAGGHLALSAASYGEGASRVASVVTYSAPVDVQLMRGDAPEITDESTPDDQRRARLADAVNSLIQDDSDSCGALCRTATQPFTASGGDAPALLFASELEWVDPQNSWRYAQAYERFPGVDVRVHELAGDDRHSIAYVDDDWGDVWGETLAWIRGHG